MFLINGYWLPVLLNLPLLVWNIKKYIPPSSPRGAQRRKGKPS